MEGLKSVLTCKLIKNIESVGEEFKDVIRGR